MADRPNVLWIQCDQLRADALGCYGRPHIQPHTPHIDGLAARGLRFDRCYCNSPVCVPSRYSILTAAYPETTGVYGNEGGRRSFEGYQVDRGLVMFPEIFAAHGYATANFGRQDLPLPAAPWMQRPVRQPTLLTTEEKQALRGSQPVLGMPWHGHRPYPGDAITETTLNWLTENDRPFLARVSYLEPHAPCMPPQPFAALFRDADMPGPGRPPEQSSRFQARLAELASERFESEAQFEDAVRSYQAAYFGIVAWIDAQVGRLMDFLDRSGRSRTTIIVLDSDHGEALGDEGCLFKHSFAPAVHRIPRLLAWPGTLPTAERDDLCEALDLGRTLLDLCGLPAPDSFKGRSLVSDPAPEAVFATIGYGYPGSLAWPNAGVGRYVDDRGWPRRACVRSHRYRLDKNIRLDGKRPVGDTEDAFLADTTNDPEERINASRDPSRRLVVQALSRLLDEHVKDSVEPPACCAAKGAVYAAR